MQLVTELPTTCRRGDGKKSRDTSAHETKNIRYENGRIKVRRDGQSGAPPAIKYRTVVSGPLNAVEAHLTMRFRSKHRVPPNGFERCVSGPQTSTLHPVSQEHYLRLLEPTGIDPFEGVGKGRG